MKKINNPIKIKVEEDKTYYWCSCGKSSKQPFCDGSHKNTKFNPVSVINLQRSFFAAVRKVKIRHFAMVHINL